MKPFPKHVMLESC